MLLMTGIAACLLLDAFSISHRVTLRTLVARRLPVACITSHSCAVTVDTACLVQHASHLMNAVELLLWIVGCPALGQASLSQIVTAEFPMPLTIDNRISDRSAVRDGKEPPRSFARLNCVSAIVTSRAQSITHQPGSKV